MHINFSNFEVIIFILPFIGKRTGKATPEPAKGIDISEGGNGHGQPARPSTRSTFSNNKPASPDAAAATSKRTKQG